MALSVVTRGYKIGGAGLVVTRGYAAGSVLTPVRTTQEFLEVSYNASVPDNNPRVTQEFLEVSYRDPLQPEPARVTQEFLEVSYNYPVPADKIRLTQQTVEVLYLERPSVAPEFDDCGNFTGVREWEARLYDKNGKRKSLGGSST